jgi:hypothetical protein
MLGNHVMTTCTYLISSENNVEKDVLMGNLKTANLILQPITQGDFIIKAT